MNYSDGAALATAGVGAGGLASTGAEIVWIALAAFALVAAAFAAKRTVPKWHEITNETE